MIPAWERSRAVQVNVNLVEVPDVEGVQRTVLYGCEPEVFFIWPSNHAGIVRRHEINST
jgi:hypothetical protein